ncbi:YraN family protein [Tepidicaulis sp. LMO-SS28]|uniref:YraN family protein n=1 Tax=Tepidicaulis sp. LMO-SS28 TaxID=3447455 RepID=UPI003EE1695F
MGEQRKIKPNAARKRAERQGRRAELLARALLTLKGYRCLARNFKRGVGEVDLIMARGRTLIFVEVKRRETFTAAAEAIHPRQQARITRAAEAFLAQHTDYAEHDLRFDAVLVVPGRWPVHLRDAWR